MHDVYSLGNAHTLELRCCRVVTIVSALGKVNTLDLSECIYTNIPEPPPEPVVTTGALEDTLSFHHYQ